MKTSSEGIEPPSSGPKPDVLSIKLRALGNMVTQRDFIRLTNISKTLKKNICYNEIGDTWIRNF